MDQDRIAVLMANYLAGELSPEENEELEWAILANPALGDTLKTLQRMQELPPAGSSAAEQEMLERGLRRLRALDEPVPVAAYRPLPNSLYQEAGKVRKLSWWWAAASAILVLGGAGLLIYKTNNHAIAPAAPSAQNKEIATRW